MRVLLLSALLVTIAACASGPGPELASDMPPPFDRGERAAPDIAAAPIAAPMMPAPQAAPSPPPQAASSPIVLAPMAAPPGPEAMPQPVPLQMANEPPPEAAPAPAAPFGSLFGSPAPRRLTLSNFSFDKAHVVAVATASLDCAARREGDSEVNFELPLNGTRIIEVPPGSDVCWRREIDQAQSGGGRRWSAWNRAYVSVGGSVDSRL